MDQNYLTSTLEQAKAFFASKGLHFTKQREILIKVIFLNEDYFNPSDLIAKLDTVQPVSRATVYRTIALLVEGGMLREIALESGERLYDPNFLRNPHHNHLICEDCRKVVEFEDQNIDVMQNCITHRLGFSPTQKVLRIEGSCDHLRLLGTCPNFKEERA